MSRFELKNGKLLVAEPFMQDAHFKKAVLALCDYSLQDGAVAFILNRPTNLKMDEVMHDFPEFDSLIYYGGPVANDTIHYIHRAGELVDGSREVIPGLYWGGDFNKLKVLIKKEVLKPMDIRFYIGYAGWTSGQLEEEIDIKSWVIDDLDINFPFLKDSIDLWQSCLQTKGNHLAVLADMSDSVSLN